MEYEQFLQGVGIEKGDIIDVASDMVSILMYCRKRKIEFNPDDLLDALKNLVGPEGTVMVRMFNWDFCHGTPFDMSKSPSRVGALGNTALKRSDFIRTAHPLYSWMVCGKYAGELAKMNNTCAFGPGTPFDFLYTHGGKQFTLGNTVADACTQMHHAEAVAAVPYRFEKMFTGEYTDLGGNTSLRTYSQYVRYLDVKVENINTDEGERLDTLKELGILTEKYYDDALRVSVIDLRQITDFFVKDIEENEGRFIVNINGLPGYKEAGIDYESLEKK